MKKAGFILKSTAILSTALLLMAADVSKTIEHTIKKGKANKVKAALNLPAGKMSVKPGSSDLCKGTFSFVTQAQKPLIAYEETGNETGSLRITTEGDNNNINHIKTENVWDLALNFDIINALEINMVAGQGVVDLSNTQPEYLHFHMVAGEALLNLSNSSVQNVEVNALAGNVKLI